MEQRQGYSPVQIALHWLVVLLIAVNYIVSDGMGRALRSHLKGETVTGLTPTVHVYLGLALLALVLVRLAVRLFRGTPPELAGGPDWAAPVARWTHRLLYLLLLAVPLLGVLAWYGGVHEAGDIHVLAMNAMLILAGLHAAAALAHHFVLRDEGLMRMLRPR